MSDSDAPSREILEQFAISGTLTSLEELKRGHINRTFIACWSSNGHERRYVHQSINHRIFTDVDGLMRNIALITATLLESNKSPGDQFSDRTLSIVPSRAGELYVCTPAGSYWRTFDYIESTDSYDVCPDRGFARESAAILGRFQRGLLTLDPRTLHDTIPYFHDGARRIAALEDAVQRDVVGRSKAASADISFALARKNFCSLLIESLRAGRVPWRAVHNDMKLNNVLFAKGTSRAISIVDLDTCMAGSTLFDFGDLVRNTAVPCEEDEQDFTKVYVDLDLYTALCEGYLSEAASFLSAPEIELLPLAPRVLALTLGVRFLTDYLQGDTYFRIHRPLQNLERARTQFAIVSAMEAAEQEMRDASRFALT